MKMVKVERWSLKHSTISIKTPFLSSMNIIPIVTSEYKYYKTEIFEIMML